jgi:autotransporter-like protein/autochaperone domain-containing protein
MQRSRHRRSAWCRGVKRGRPARPNSSRALSSLPRLRSADRKSLLLGTALASTLLLGTVIAPGPAHAVDCFAAANPPPGASGPIIVSPAINDFITCTNTDDRFNNPALPQAGAVIRLLTTGALHYIDLYNSGDLTSISNALVGYGISAISNGNYSAVSIVNRGDILATTTANSAYGIAGDTNGTGSPVSIVNSGDISATSVSDPAGIGSFTTGAASPVSITNSGDLTVTGTGPYSSARGIFVSTLEDNSPTTIVNSGDIKLTAQTSALGIRVYASGMNAPVNIVNSGDIEARSLRADGQAFGINGTTFDDASPVAIENHGSINASAGRDAFGLYAYTVEINSPIAILNDADVSAAANIRFAVAISARAAGGDPNSPISIVNSGDLSATASGFDAQAIGIRATSGYFSPISIENSGDVTVVATGAYSYATGIRARTNSAGSPIAIANSGALNVTGAGKSYGIYAYTRGAYSPINVENSGDIDPDIGIGIRSTGDNSPINVDNSGDIEADQFGIFALSYGANSTVTIVNSGTVALTGNFPYESAAITGIGIGDGSSVVINNSGSAQGLGAYGVGIYALAPGAGGTTLITNSGSLYGGFAGILALSAAGTKIVNSGDISAGSFLAIGVGGAAAQIYNSGHITGFVGLTKYGDTFVNENHGVFETKLTSYFGYGSDLFVNEQGGTVLAATNPKMAEFSQFVELERFENRGLISLQDGQVGDTFRISNSFVTAYGYTVYAGASPIVFNGSGKSQLAIDAFLGGPGSTADNFIIDGNVSGATKVDVNNTNPGPGVFNKEGIPVIFVNGATPKGDEFFLSQPIDTGFFNYDLFFRPTGSGIFELRSFLGQGAFVLPQLITAAQDTWHETSSTWFDRSTDLRVLLNGGGAAPLAYGPNWAPEAATSGNITPAVWVRGSGNWLDRQDSQSVTTYGRSYQYNLNRNLETIDFQSGIDLGKRGLLSDNDILVFGALGGFVHSDLDYDAINRLFSFEGGQVGGYATYLRGGLFVDTLVNVHLMEIETRTLGFPNSLDATTVGVRTDSGYRFGSFNGGAFIEPLATIAVDWADIDGFSRGGNKVSFDDDANVRGRLGLRVGTTMQVWAGTTMEPFVIGSLWGNLSGDDNQATLVSTGTTFILKDDLQDVWGEVSAGVNFFNPSANTSVFAKLDVTFGDDIDGVGGKAGMRVSW